MLVQRKLNLHIYPSPFRNESRILKETKSIIDLGLCDEVIIAATWKEGLSVEEYIDEKRKVHRFKSFFQNLPENIITDALRFTHYMFLVFFRFKKEKPDYVNCHSLSVLFVGVLFKKITQSQLIYDPHELETERAGLKGIKQKISKWLERKLIKYIDHLIVVSDSIGEWYKREYNLKEVFVIRNIPDNRNTKTGTSTILKDKFNIPDNDLLFIYQGLLSKGRGLELLLNTFAEISTNKHLVIMGYGVLEPIIKKYESKYTNIHFQEAVKPEEIMRYTEGCDIGISLIENIGLSYYYCLPNKFFEYILSGIPVIASDFPDMSFYINKTQCGWIAKPEKEAFVKVLNEIKLEDVILKKKNCTGLNSTLGWHNEEKSLIPIYRSKANILNLIL